MFIVCKKTVDGSLIAGSTPKVHLAYGEAKSEAERLAVRVPDAESFIVFKAISRSTKVVPPVVTVSL